MAALGMAALIAVACSKRDNEVIRNDSAAGTVSATDTARRVMSTDWTDESILAYLRAANRDEIKVNELAAKKATAPAVKQFAQKMAADHRAGLKEVEALMGKTKMAHDTMKMADTLHEKAHDVVEKSRDEVKDLTEKAAGADWDKDYINLQIDEHKEVIDKLTDAAKNTANKDLQALLVKMTGTVQEHLTKAEAIKTTLK
jgi:putative membrane protein